MSQSILCCTDKLRKVFRQDRFDWNTHVTLQVKAVIFKKGEKYNLQITMYKDLPKFQKLRTAQILANQEIGTFDFIQIGWKCDTNLATFREKSLCC